MNNILEINLNDYVTFFIAVLTIVGVVIFLVKDGFKKTEKK